MRIFQVLMWALTCSTMYLTRLMLRLLEPVSVVRWVPWSAARLVLPSGQALGKKLPMEQIVSFTSGGIKGFLSGSKLSWLNRYYLLLWLLL